MTKAEVARAHAEWHARAAEHKALLQVVVSLEQHAKQKGLDVAQREEARKLAAAELDDVNAQAAGVETQLEAGRLATEARRAEAERCTAEAQRVEAVLRQLHVKQARTSQFASRQERDRHLESEAKELRASLRKIEAQAETLLSAHASDQGNERGPTAGC